MSIQKSEANIYDVFWPIFLGKNEKKSAPKNNAPPVQERLGISRNGLNRVVGLRKCYSKCVYRTLKVKGGGGSTRIFSSTIFPQNINNFDV